MDVRIEPVGVHSSEKNISTQQEVTQNKENCILRFIPYL
jgi:hypothetical protein